MDAETSKKISVLAANLKKLHLAATMEEAFQRAKEMILHHKVDTPIGDLVRTEENVLKAEKTIGELHRELDKESKELEKKSISAEEKGDVAQKKLGEIKCRFEVDKRMHDLEKSDTVELKDSVKQVKKGKEEIEDIVEEADRVQAHPEEK